MEIIYDHYCDPPEVNILGAAANSETVVAVLDVIVLEEHVGSARRET